MSESVPETATAAGAVAAKPREKTIFDLVMGSKEQLALALPKHIPVDRMLRVVITAMRRTPKLQKCNAMSLLGSIMTCGQLGLEPNDPRGLAYLIPYGEECQLIIGYRGYIDLAMRSGMVTHIQAMTVYEKDTFEYEQGLDMKLRHVPYMGAEDPGKVVASYAIATMPNGAKAIVVLPRRDIDRARLASSSVKAGRPSPWDDWFPEMAMKTAVRRLAKFMPQSPEFAHAVEVDGAELRLNAITSEVDITPAEAEFEERVGGEEADAAGKSLGDRLAAKAAAVQSNGAGAPAASDRALTEAEMAENDRKLDAAGASAPASKKGAK